MFVMKPKSGEYFGFCSSSLYNFSRCQLHCFALQPPLHRPLVSHRERFSMTQIDGKCLTTFGIRHLIVIQHLITRFLFYFRKSLTYTLTCGKDLLRRLGSRTRFGGSAQRKYVSQRNGRKKTCSDVWTCLTPKRGEKW